MHMTQLQALVRYLLNVQAKYKLLQGLLLCIHIFSMPDAHSVDKGVVVYLYLHPKPTLIMHLSVNTTETLEWFVCMSRVRIS